MSQLQYNIFSSLVGQHVCLACLKWHYLGNNGLV